MKGLTYVVTDRGPMKTWLKVISRSDSALCDCRQVQNAAHLLRCGLVGDRRGRRIEECYEDKEWCKAVEELLRS